MANEIRPEDVRRIAAQKEREVLGEEGIRRFAEPSLFAESVPPRRAQENPYERSAPPTYERQAYEGQSYGGQSYERPMAAAARGPYDQGARGPYEDPGYDPAGGSYGEPQYEESYYEEEGPGAVAMAAPPRDAGRGGRRERGYADDDYGDEAALAAGYGDGGYDDEGGYEEPPRRRRWLPMTVALLALVGFAGVVWYAYDWGSTGSVGGEPPLIQAQAGEEKVKPENEGGIEVPNQETSVLNPQPAQPVTEVLMPPPEEPVAPPQPAAAPQPAPEEPAVELVETTPPAAAAPPAPPPAEPVAGSDPAAPPAAPEQPAAAQPAAPAPAPQIAAGDFLIQLASLTSPDAAQRAWSNLQQKHAGLLGDMALNIQEANIEGKGIYYRVQAGPLPNRATADDMCARLKAAQQDCIVVKR